MLKCVLSTLCVALVAAAWPAGAQIPYKRGQDVQPAFEGWYRNADGSYSLVFAYFNRNYEEVLDIPIGPDNTMQPGGPDRGQPTHFDVRRQRLVFSVTVPGTWTKSDKLVWTLTSHGQTNTAKGWLLPEWELTPQVISQDLGGGNTLHISTQAFTLGASVGRALPLNKEITLLPFGSVALGHTTMKASANGLSGSSSDTYLQLGFGAGFQLSPSVVLRPALNVLAGADLVDDTIFSFGVSFALPR